MPPRYSPWSRLVLQLLGMATGGSIMLVIAIHEHELKTLFSEWCQIPPTLGLILHYLTLKKSQTITFDIYVVFIMLLIDDVISRIPCLPFFMFFFVCYKRTLSFSSEVTSFAKIFYTFWKNFFLHCTKLQIELYDKMNKNLIKIIKWTFDSLFLFLFCRMSFF